MLSLRLHSIQTIAVADESATAFGKAVYPALSVALHATLVLAFFLVNDWTRALAELAGSARDASYLAPPDRRLASHGTVERVHYVRTDLSAGVPAPLDRPIRSPVARTVAVAPAAEQAPASSAEVETIPGADSVYSILEVDSAARRYPWSAAPVYPRALLEKGVEGAVIAEYIVDTTGVADTASFHVHTATHPEFVEAVRTALPNMRFAPAKIGSLAVRLLVQQTFTFKLQPAGAAAAAADTTARSTAGRRPRPPAR